MQAMQSLEAATERSQNAAMKRRAPQLPRQWAACSPDRVPLVDVKLQC